MQHYFSFSVNVPSLFGHIVYLFYPLLVNYIMYCVTETINIGKIYIIFERERIRKRGGWILVLKKLVATKKHQQPKDYSYAGCCERVALGPGRLCYLRRQRPELPALLPGIGMLNALSLSNTDRWCLLLREKTIDQIRQPTNKKSDDVTDREKNLNT